jgi:hypothetical protein
MKIPASNSSRDWQIVAEAVLFFLIAAVSAWPMISAIDAILRLT